MAAQDSFIKALHLLDEQILAGDPAAIRAFAEGVYQPIICHERSSFHDYMQAQQAKIFAELKASIAGQLEKVQQGHTDRLTLRKGRTIKHGNIRFFDDNAKLTAGKYLVLFKHIDSEKTYVFVVDFNGQNTFQVSFKNNLVAKTIADIDGNYHSYILASLTPALRCYEATCQPNTALLTAIAAGDTDHYHLTQPAPLPVAYNQGLNDSQQQAMAGFVRLGEGCQLLMGPPGTGKTTTITRTIKALTQVRNIGKVVVCGPSNKSVQVIAAALKRKHPELRIALYCHESNLDPASKDELVELLVSQQQGDLQAAQVVLMTLSASGSRFIRDNLRNPSAVVIDEAGQASTDVLIPFALQPRKVLLVGDPKQLPPTVLSDNAEALHHNWSMLKRLITICNQRHYLLNTQYRMHPAISEFPRENFYDGRVADGVAAAARERSDIAPYAVEAISGREELDIVTRSFKNLAEAQRVVAVIQQVMTKGYRQNDIAIITPYKAQADLIKLLLQRHGLSTDQIKVNTVDSFQGEESPVVIVSMVRANQQARIGFLKHPERLNVAITRPREVLRILINGETFNPLHPRSAFENDLWHVAQLLAKMTMPWQEKQYDVFSEHYSERGTFYHPEGFRGSLADYEEPVEDYYSDWGEYLYDDNGNIKTYFAGPRVIQQFIKLLEHYRDRYSSTFGNMPIFFLPFLPKGTHIIQDILDRVKVWRKLSFAGLPDDMFQALKFNRYSRTQECIEDYGYPFDENDNYCPEGYSLAYYDEENMDRETSDLHFNGHHFIACDLRDVNFHNSQFTKTLFTGSDVRGCKVNPDKMDAISRQSYLEAQARNRLARHQGDLLPTEKLVIDAMRRNIYQQSGRQVLFFEQVPAEPAQHGAAAAAALPAPGRQG